MISRYLLILLAAMVASSNPDVLEKDSSQNGVIMFYDEPFSHEPQELNGYWEFYPNELIGSPEIVNRSTKAFIEVPFWWTEEVDKPSVQFATYRLQVVLPSKYLSSSLALCMPEVYCSYDLWINGKMLGQNGVVGKTKIESTPQWKPETYVFQSNRDTLEIIIHLSNYYHHRAGIAKPILLGEADQLLTLQNKIETSNTVLFIGLSILAIGAGIFYLRLGSTALLFYVLLCLSWIIRSAFSNHYQITQWFPDTNWYLIVRTEYISLYLSTMFGSLLVGSLFPREVNKLFFLFFIITSGCFTLFTLIAPPLVFTTFVQFYLGLSTILLLSILVIIIKAYAESREGAGSIFITAMLTVGLFGYVILAYQGVFKLDELVINIGFLTLFLIILFTVVRRINKMKTTQDYDMMTFDEATKWK